MTSTLIWISGVLSVFAGSIWVYSNLLLPKSNHTASKDSLQIASQLRVAQQDPTAPLPSLIIPCITSHRRTIPVSAIHSFSYPLIYLGLDLDDLESGKLDLPRSRGFIYGAKPWKSVLGIQKDAYLATVTDSTSSLSFRQRLVKMLTENGIKEEDVGRVWLVTMPSYFGKSSINPLTTYFVYRKAGMEGRGKDGSNLLCMVLEVHNTFEERHVYVLRTGVNEEDEDRSTLTAGHHHAWIFPRSFHVSPFNNRAGYYRLDVQDPFYSEAPPSTEYPKFKVTLNLLTTAKESKLYAVLMNHPTQTATTIALRNIVSSVLFKQPWSLLLTTPRILAQAWVLHYQKGLVVYPRPEPEFAFPLTPESRSPSPSDSDATLVSTDRLSTGLDPAWNPIEADLLKVGKAIGWQSVAGTEKYAERTLVVPWLKTRCEELGVGLRVVFTNQGRKEVVMLPSKTGSAVLRVTTRHPFFFTQLVIAETPTHFLLPALHDFHTHVSSPELFRKVFTPTSTGETTDMALATRWASTLRRKHLLFLLGFANKPPQLDILLDPPGHFLTYRGNGQALSLGQRLMILRIVAASYYVDKLEEWIMYAVGARFVAGQEPWGVWRRVTDAYWARGSEEKNLAQQTDTGAVRGMTREEEEMDRQWGSILLK